MGDERVYRRLPARPRRAARGQARDDALGLYAFAATGRRRARARPRRRGRPRRDARRGEPRAPFRAHPDRPDAGPTRRPGSPARPRIRSVTPPPRPPPPPPPPPPP